MAERSVIDNLFWYSSGLERPRLWKTFACFDVAIPDCDFFVFMLRRQLSKVWQYHLNQHVEPYVLFADRFLSLHSGWLRFWVERLPKQALDHSLSKFDKKYRQTVRWVSDHGRPVSSWTRLKRCSRPYLRTGEHEYNPFWASHLGSGCWAIGGGSISRQEESDLQ